MIKKTFLISGKIIITSHGHFILDITCNSLAKEAWALGIGYILTISNQTNVSNEVVPGAKINYVTVSFSLFVT